MTKTLNRLGIARRIQEQCPELLIKDILQVLETEESVLCTALKAHETIKLGKLYKLTVETKPARQHYDGIHQKTIDLPDREVVKEHQLSVIKTLFDEKAG